MLRAVRKRKKARVANTPLLEQIHGGTKQLLSDAAIPHVGPDGERAEKADASPSRGEVCSDEFSPEFSAKNRRGIGQPARPHVFGVAHKIQGVGQTKKCAESKPHYSVRSGKIFLAQQANRSLWPLLYRC